MGIATSLRAAVARWSERQSFLFQYTLFCMFGMGAWLMINGTFVELPMLASTLPEGYAVANWLSIALQVANVFPAVFVAYSERTGRRDAQLYISVINAVMALGIATCVALAFFWDSTVVVAGHRRSVPLFVMVFLAGAVDCASTVTFWPLTSMYPSAFIIAMSVGQGLSGFVPSLLGVFQSPDAARRFSVGTYFVLLGVLMAISACAFTVLHLTYEPKDDNGRVSDKTQLVRMRSPSPFSRRKAYTELDSSPADAAGADTSNNFSYRWFSLAAVERDKAHGGTVAVWRYSHGVQCVLASLGLVSALQNSVVTSLSTYTFLPFTSGGDWLFWSNIIATSLDPVSASLPMMSRLRIPTLPALFLFVSLCVALTAAVVFGAAWNPTHKEFQKSTLAAALLAVSFVVLRALSSFTKACCWAALQAHFNHVAVSKVTESVGEDENEDDELDDLRREQQMRAVAASTAAASKAVGTVVQLCSLVASVVMFVLVNVVHAFDS